MNPIVLYMASGESLLSGAALLLVLVAGTPFIRNRWLLRVRSLLLWTSLAMMVMASPPFPYWLDGVFLAAFLVWMAAWSRLGRPTTPRRQRFRLLAGGVLIVLTFLLPALEIPWRQRPVFAGTPTDHLVVIGDSISAGISEGPTWPEIYQALTDVPVTNLAAAGAETSDALSQSKKLRQEDTLVLLEIGGNDLLGGVSAAEFEVRLDRLLAACAAPDRTLIMFELPLLPHRIGYGRVQRRLAAQYHVQLIPKRFLIEAFRAGTSDGLHLAPAGAQRMALLVDSFLNPLLTPPAPPVTPPQTAR